MKTLTTIAFALLFNSFTFCQTVSTITAGNFTDGLAQDSNGVIYCSDWGGNIVYKLDTLGTVSIFKGGFSNPNGIAIDDTNQVYVCDHTDNRIEKYNQSGVLIRNYNGFNSPAGIKKLPNSNNFIVVEYNFGRVKILQPDGMVSLMHSGTPLNGPAGIALIDTNVFIANFNDRKIYAYHNGSLNFLAQLPSFPGTYNSIGFLTALHGKLYATHVSGNKIYEIDPTSGVISLFAGSSQGSQDGALASATFNRPNGILADEKTNRLYVSEAGSKNLRIIDNVVVSTDENTIEIANFSVFPNPATSVLNVEFSNQINTVEFSIYNSLGQEIISEKQLSTNGKIQLSLKDSLFPSGNYVLNLKSGNAIASKLFIVQ